MKKQTMFVAICQSICEPEEVIKARKGKGRSMLGAEMR
jgi:hypothetical protein